MIDHAKLLGAWAGLSAVILVCGIGAAYAAYGLYQIAHVASLTVGGM